MFALPFLLAAVTASPSPAPSPSLDDRITAAVGTGWDKLHAPGTAVGITRNGQLIYVKGFGMRDVAKQLPIDDQTRFQVGSVTKMFTAAAILQLKERGMLSLDDRLAKYVPSFPHAKDVTLRQLLNQISGLPEYTEVSGFIRNSGTPGSLQKVESLIAHKPLDFKPGSQWEYSNSNYYALGAVVASVSHQSYEAFIRAHEFEPAHMTHSGFIGEASMQHDAAVPYWRGMKGDQPLAPAPPLRAAWAGGAGEIVSTVGDLAKWDAALADGSIITHDDYALMRSPGLLSDGKPTSYGMGWVIDSFDGHARIWHNGGTNGSMTMNATFPQDHVDIIVFENMLGASVDRTEATVFETIFPEAAAAARQPAAGEDPAVTARIRAVFDGLQQGTLKTSDLTPNAQKHFTPELLATVHQELGPLGPPVAVIYKGMRESGGDMEYTYRFDFARETLMLRMDIDKATNLVSGVHLLPG